MGDGAKRQIVQVEGTIARIAQPDFLPCAVGRLGDSIPPRFAMGGKRKFAMAQDWRTPTEGGRMPR